MCDQPKRQRPTFVPLKNLSDKKKFTRFLHKTLNLVTYHFKHPFEYHLQFKKINFLLRPEKRKKTSKSYYQDLYGLNIAYIFPFSVFLSWNKKQKLFFYWTYQTACHPVQKQMQVRFTRNVFKDAVPMGCGIHQIFQISWIFSVVRAILKVMLYPDSWGHLHTASTLKANQWYLSQSILLSTEKIE